MSTRVTPSILAPALTLALLLPPATGLAAQDLTLKEAVESAIESHPAMAGAGARVDGAEAALGMARARSIPDVTGTGSLTRYQEPMVVAPLHGFDPLNPPAFDRTLAQAGVSMGYTLFDGGVRGSRIREGEAGVAALRAIRSATEMKLVEEATDAFLALATAREVAEAARHQTAALQAEATRAEQRFAEGSAARVEVLRAQAALLDVVAQTASATSRVALMERALARVMGVPLDQVEDASLTPVSVADAGGVEPGPDEPPSVLAARRGVEMAQARLRGERATRLPTVQARGGLLSFMGGGVDPIVEWQAGVGLSWPIFTGGTRSASIRRAESEVRAAQEDLRSIRMNEDAAADAARASLTETTARTRALEAAVVQWEEVARIEALGLESGAGVQSDFLQAEAGLFRARAGLAQARHEGIMAHLRLARAEGRLTLEWLERTLEMER